MPAAVAVADAHAVAEIRGVQQETLDIPIPLISGGRATLRIPIPMSESDYVLLKGMITANLEGLKEAIVRKSPRPEGV